MKKTALALLLILLLVGCSRQDYNTKRDISINTAKGTIAVQAEIADTDAERAQGLMFRQSMPGNQGMLFIFGKEEHQIFWMKNTLIPLDIIFIGKDLEIVDIQHAVPCTADPCPLYKSVKPAKYVLEVNANFTTNNNITIGSKVKI